MYVYCLRDIQGLDFLPKWLINTTFKKGYNPVPPFICSKCHVLKPRQRTGAKSSAIASDLDLVLCLGFRTGIFEHMRGGTGLYPFLKLAFITDVTILVKNLIKYF